MFDDPSQIWAKCSEDQRSRSNTLQEGQSHHLCEDIHEGRTMKAKKAMEEG